MARGSDGHPHMIEDSQPSNAAQGAEWADGPELELGDDNDDDDAPPGLISGADALSAMNTARSEPSGHESGERGLQPRGAQPDYADLPPVVPASGHAAPVHPQSRVVRTPDFTPSAPVPNSRTAKEVRKKAQREEKKKLKAAKKEAKEAQRSKKKEASGGHRLDTEHNLGTSIQAHETEAVGAWGTPQQAPVLNKVADVDGGDDFSDNDIPSLGGHGSRPRSTINRQNHPGCLGGCQQDPPNAVTLDFEPAKAMVQLRDAEDDRPSDAEDALLRVENCTRFSVARFFRLLRTVVNIVLTIVFEALRFALTVIAKVLVDMITISSHTLLKPCLNTTFNQCCQPCFVVLREALEAFKLIIRPFFAAFDPLADVIAKILT